jgi:very-short-patch-repair endonuclease
MVWKSLFALNVFKDMMVTISPDDSTRKHLPPGYSASPKIFREMDLSVGDIFTNKEGTKLIIVEASFGDKWYTQRMEDTNLEKEVRSILKETGIEEYVKEQFHPSNVEENYRIDFAVPSIRLAIEPHASYLWEVNDGQEEKKERSLKSIGWDVLWLDEGDLEDRDEAESVIRNEISNVVDEISVVDETKIQKQAGGVEISYYLPEEKFDTVVYQGKVVPQPIAELDMKFS